MAFLRIENICKDYQEGKIVTHVLNGVNLSLDEGQIVAIIGKSGSGKSTLLHLIGGLDTQTSGKIYFDDIDLDSKTAAQKAKWRNQEIGFVYQFHHLLSDFSALENVAMPLLIAGMSKRQAYEQASEYLAMVDLKDRLNYKPRELSGGQRQRVAIARALVNKPRLVLADEPTGNLDAENADLIFNLFKQLMRSLNTTLLLVTHDNNLATQADAIFTMKDGVIS